MYLYLPQLHANARMLVVLPGRPAFLHRASRRPRQDPHRHRQPGVPGPRPAAAGHSAVEL